METLLPKDPVTIDNSKEIEDLDKIVFDLSPDTSKGKLVVTTHGEKGSGKTTAMFLITTGRIGGFPSGKTNVISFDNKTKITKEQWFNNDDIVVWNGKEHYREDPSLCTKSGMISYKYMQKLIQSWKTNPPDWIVFDGLTIMIVILEMAMRFKNNLQPTEGFKNSNIWKDRSRFVQDLHNLACKVAKYGVGYTTYSEKDEIVEAGTTISKTDVPKYIDIVMQETDVVLHSTKASGKNGDLFYLKVESTKYKQYVNTDGSMIPKCETTLEQGRIFPVTNLCEIPSKKVQQPQKVIESVVLPKKEEIPQVKTESPISKLIETKPPEVKQEPPKVEEKKPEAIKWKVPDLLDL